MAFPFPASVAVPPSSSGDQTKLMIVGDSMTQGQEGDWTWRYRLWEWVRSQPNTANVTFTGPYFGTQQPDEPDRPAPILDPYTFQPVRVHGGYARDVRPAFGDESQHFAIWGRAANTDKSLMRRVVQQYPADILLIMLGFNDLGWFISDVPGTLESVKMIVDEARVAKPDIKFALANIPQRTSLGREDLPRNTTLYNQKLKTLIPAWTTPESPIHLVELREGYSCDVDRCPAGYDGLHPNALGDYEIARAFSIGLIRGFGIGATPLEVPRPVPSRQLPVPHAFTVTPIDRGLYATWAAVYGAYGYEVRRREDGTWKWNMGLTGNSNHEMWDVEKGKRYEVQVRAMCGEMVRGAWTEVVLVVA